MVKLKIPKCLMLVQKLNLTQNGIFIRIRFYWFLDFLIFVLFEPNNITIRP